MTRRIDPRYPQAPISKNENPIFWDFEFISSCNAQKSVTDPVSLYPDLGNFSHWIFWDPSQGLRNALVYRKFVIIFCVYCRVDELWRFPSGNPSKHPISGMGTFGVYCQNNIFSEQCIFRAMTLQKNDQISHGDSVMDFWAPADETKG